MGPIAAFLAADHDRLDALLGRAGEDEKAYEAFRRGLLKHVGMEEIILIPAAAKAAGRPPDLAAKIRRDHGALTALLIPPPTARLLEAVRAILKPHNRLEEDAGGLYGACEKALGAGGDAALAALRGAPDIPPAPHVDGERVAASIGRALDAAGYGALRWR